MLTGTQSFFFFGALKFMKEQAARRESPSPRSDMSFGSFHQRVRQAIALARVLDEVAVVRQAVDHRHQQALVAKDLVPLGDGQVRRQNHATLLIAVGNQLKEQSRARHVGGQIAPLVNH